MGFLSYEAGGLIFRGAYFRNFTVTLFCTSRITVSGTLKVIDKFVSSLVWIIYFSFT